VAEAVAGGADPNTNAIRNVKENMAAYARLIRVNIDKKDNILYAIADRILKPADEKKLSEAFGKVEPDEMGEGVHEKYHAWIEKLVGG